MNNELKPINNSLNRTQRGGLAPSASSLGVKKRKNTPNFYDYANKNQMDASQRVTKLKMDESRLLNTLKLIGEEKNAEADDRNWLEKFLNLDKKQGLFGDIFEVLDRPGQVVKQTLLGEGDDVIGNAWKGLTGEKEMSGVEAFKNLTGIEIKDGFSKFAIGLGMDLVTDPLTFFDAPIKLAGQGAKAAFKIGSNITRKGISLTKTGKMFLSKYDDLKNVLGNTVKDAFSLHTDKVAKGVMTQQAGAKGAVRASQEQGLNNLKNIQKQIAKDAEHIHTLKDTGEKSKIYKAMGLSDDASIEEVSKAYEREIFQNIEQGNENLSMKDIILSMGNNITEDGRGVFLIPNVNGLRDARFAAKDLKVFKDTLKEQLGRDIAKDDLILELGKDGKGAFLKASSELTQRMQRFVNKADIIAKRYDSFGVDNVVMGIIKTLGDTGVVTMHLNIPAEKELFNTMNNILGKKLGVKAEGNIVEVSLNRRELTQFLDDPNNSNLVDYLRKNVANPIKGEKYGKYKQKAALDIIRENMVWNKRGTLPLGVKIEDLKVNVVGINKAVTNNAKVMAVQYDALQKITNKDFFSITSSKVSDVLLKNTELQISQITRNLEGVKQQIYSIPKLLGNDKLIDVAKNLNIDGYMRHIASPESVMWHKLKSLEPGSNEATNLLKQFSVGKSTDQLLMERKWHGSAKDINNALGHNLFSTNPIESMAVTLKLLPEKFLAVNLFENAMEQGVVRQIDDTITAAAQTLLKNDPLLRVNEAVAKSLPKEYRLLDKDAVNKLRDTFNFLEKGGAKFEDVQILKGSLENILSQKGGIIHRGVYNQIIDYGKRLNETGVNQVLTMTRKFIINPWKRLALFSMGYHLRNFGSNAMNGYLAGMNPIHYANHFSKASSDLVTIENHIIPKINDVLSSGKAELKTIEGQSKLIEEVLSPKEKVLFNEMMEWQQKGVIGSNKFNADHYDLMNNINTVINKSKLGKTVEYAKRVSDMSFKFGKLSDDASRLAAYRWAKNTKSGQKRLQRLGMNNPEEFSRYAFFDFNDMSPFEERVMRGIFPFYTWARKNFEFHVRNIIEQPSRYIRFNKFLSSWNGAWIESEDDITQWDKQEMLMPIPGVGGNGKITFMKLSPTYLDMEDVMSSNILSRLSPVIKAPLESITGKNFFTHKDLHTNMFSQFSEEMFGSLDNFEKILKGDFENIDKNKLGMLGNKLSGILETGGKIVKGDIDNILSDLLPSFFKEEDITTNQENNIKARVSQLAKYLNDLRKNGRYVPSERDLAGVLPRIRVNGRIPNMSRKRRVQ